MKGNKMTINTITNDAIAIIDAFQSGTQPLVDTRTDLAKALTAHPESVAPTVAHVIDAYKDGLSIYFATAFVGIAANIDPSVRFAAMSALYDAAQTGYDKNSILSAVMPAARAAFGKGNGDVKGFTYRGDLSHPVVTRESADGARSYYDGAWMHHRHDGQVTVENCRIGIKTGGETMRASDVAARFFVKGSPKEVALQSFINERTPQMQVPVARMA